MAVHELATNAAKYGALSAPEGRVQVSWALAADGALRLSWREAGGPPVRPPSREGFGSSVIRRAFTGRANGAASLDWRPEGLACEILLRPGDGAS